METSSKFRSYSPDSNESLDLIPQRSGRKCRRPFRSTKNEADFHFIKEPLSPQARFARRLPWIAFALGILMIVAGAYWGYSEVPKHTFTKVIWYEDFSAANYNLLDDFSRDVAFGGFGKVFRHLSIDGLMCIGTGSVEFNSDFDNNSFVENHQLHLRAELADPWFNTDGVKVNLTEQGRCTVAYTEDNCVGTRNVSRGSYYSPVNSARLITKGKHHMRYGRLEVNAKMPLGDWFWPAIWALPEATTYGIWPASGEIDIIESRGNAPGFLGGGYDTVQSSYHLAPVGGDVYTNNGIPGNHGIPIPMSDIVSISPSMAAEEEKNADGLQARTFRTYGMDWTPQGIRIWVDEPIYILKNFRFELDPFTNFKLPTTDEYGVPLDNPWLISPHKSAPFDMDFYLILNIAVGAGYFAQAPEVRTFDEHYLDQLY